MTHPRRWTLLRGMLGLLGGLVGFLVWWNHDSNPPARLTIPYPGQSSGLGGALGFSLDSRFYAINGPQGTITYDLATSRPTATQHALAIFARDFSPDRSRFAGWSVADQAVVWGDTATTRVQGSLPVACSPQTLLPNLSWVEGNHKVELVTIDPAQVPRSSDVLTWDITAGTSTQRTVRGPQPFERPIAYAPDGTTWVYLDTVHDALQLWDSVTDRPVGPLLRTPTTRRNLTQQIFTAAGFTPDGRTLIASQGEGRVEFWDLATQRSTRTLPVLPSDYQITQALRVSPDGFLLAATGHRADPTGWVGWTWDLLRRKVTGKTMSQDSQLTVIIDLTSGKPLAHYQHTRFSQFSHDSRLFSTEDTDRTISIHDAPVPEP